MKRLGPLLIGAFALILTSCSQAFESRDVDIAIVDTGVNSGIAQLAPFTIKQRDPSPSSGHGTMVLSVILGVNGNEFKPLPADRVTVHSFDTGNNPTASSLARAINDAVDKKVDLISISMGVRRSDPALEEAVGKADRAGIPIVAAAGNVRFLAPDFPARYEQAISVSTTDEHGKYWDGAAQRDIDTVAKGVNYPVITEDGSTKLETGTSISTAVISHEIVSQLLDGTISQARDYQPPQPPSR